MRATLERTGFAESADTAFAGLVFAESDWLHAEFDDIVSASFALHSHPGVRTGCGSSVTQLPRPDGTTSAVASTGTSAAPAAPRAKQRSPPHPPPACPPDLADREQSRSS